jgi:hypothetical protein
MIATPAANCWKKGEKKKGKPTSHRYNRLPLLPSDPGGVQQELIVLACRCEDNRIAPE